jgi:uncharacterized membrane protein
VKWVKLGSLVLMGAFYVFAGWNHFANPEFYRPMMPPYLPAHDLLIVVSGAAEIALGIAVLIPRTRVLAAWGIVALLVAVVPANFHIAIHDIPIGGAAEGGGALNWVRIAFQPVLMLWAWWHTRRDPQS